MTFFYFFFSFGRVSFFSGRFPVASEQKFGEFRNDNNKDWGYKLTVVAFSRVWSPQSAMAFFLSLFPAFPCFSPLFPVFSYFISSSLFAFLVAFHLSPSVVPHPPPSSFSCSSSYFTFSHLFFVCLDLIGSCFTAPAAPAAPVNDEFDWFWSKFDGMDRDFLVPVLSLAVGWKIPPSSPNRRLSSTKSTVHYTSA